MPLVVLNSSFLLYSFLLLATYRRELDSFPYLYILPGCAVLAIIINQNHRRLFEYIYAFSLYVESVAILPQLVLLVEQREISNMTSNYIACLGSYRALYILNWIWRYFTEGYKPWIAWIWYYPNDPLRRLLL